jgi:3-dehydroquinate synthase
MNIVEVQLAERSYDICVSNGLLNTSGELVRRAAGDKAQRAIIISNETVYPLYGPLVSRSLKRSGFKSDYFLIRDGEQFKTLKTVQDIYTFLIKSSVERSDIIVALGGGVLGDIAGFAAATFLRGIRYVQIPTTLLAQIDSSVGGKTGVNHQLGKNLVGSFHQPIIVLIDLDTLTTLPAREFRAGLFEAIKYGVIRDSELFTRIVKNLDELKRLDQSELDHNYRRFLHGEAVGIGMVTATRLAELAGLLPEEAQTAIKKGVEGVGPLPSTKNIALDAIMAAMQHDKKAEAGKLTFVLPVEIGRVVFKSDLSPRLVRSALKDSLA